MSEAFPQPTKSMRTVWVERASYVLGPLAVIGCGWWLLTPTLKPLARPAFAEPRSNLKDVCTAELVFQQEQGRLTVDMAELGWSPERRNRYTYYVDPKATMQRRDSETVNAVASHSNVEWDRFVFTARGESFGPAGPLPEKMAGDVRIGLNGECPACSLVVVAGADLHLNGRLDVWSVSTAPRTAPDGASIPVCVPFHERDGLTPP